MPFYIDYKIKEHDRKPIMLFFISCMKFLFYA